MKVIYYLLLDTGTIRERGERKKGRERGERKKGRESQREKGERARERRGERMKDNSNYL